MKIELADDLESVKIDELIIRMLNAKAQGCTEIIIKHQSFGYDPRIALYAIDSKQQ